jgi:hypothetical protein
LVVGDDDADVASDGLHGSGGLLAEVFHAEHGYEIETHQLLQVVYVTLLGGEDLSGHVISVRLSLQRLVHHASTLSRADARLHPYQRPFRLRFQSLRVGARCHHWQGWFRRWFPGYYRWLARW